MTADLTLRTTQLRKDWELALSVRNLFNANAREPTSGSSAINIPNDLPLRDAACMLNCGTALRPCVPLGTSPSLSP